MLHVFVCACVRACVRACLCVRACVHARARARVCGVRACVCVLRGAGRRTRLETEQRELCRRAVRVRAGGRAHRLLLRECHRCPLDLARWRRVLRGLLDDARGGGDHEELRVHRVWVRRGERRQLRGPGEIKRNRKQIHEASGSRRTRIDGGGRTHYNCA